ncbi:MAG: hypothetical protein U0736_17065 [Gemmataceae bacterium]
MTPCLRPRRPRLQLEPLEDRRVPTMSVLYGQLPDANGNLNLTFTTTGSTLEVAQTNYAQFRLTDNAGGSLIVNNVFGDLRISARSLNAAGLTATLALDGTTYGDIPGNVTFNLAALNPTSPVDFQLTAATPSNVLGDFTLTTTAAAASAARFEPAADTAILGNLTVRLQGGTAAHLKTVTLGDGAAAFRVNGTVYAPLLNQFDARTGTQLLGNLTVTTKTTTGVANLFRLADKASVAGYLSVVMGNVFGGGTSSVVLGGDLAHVTSIRLGFNSGPGTTNQVTLQNTMTSSGNLVFIQGANGSKRVNVQGATAPLAMLLVRVGNAPLNQVIFSGANQFASGILIGGLGVNKVSGAVAFPLRLYRFSY